MCQAVHSVSLATAQWFSMPFGSKPGHKLKSWCTAVARSASNEFTFLKVKDYVKNSIVSTGRGAKWWQLKGKLKGGVITTVQCATGGPSSRIKERRHTGGRVLPHLLLQVTGSSFHSYFFSLSSEQRSVLNKLKVSPLTPFLSQTWKTEMEKIFN